jgi:16S rRNA (uracil1498-N3)-methyltransferase
MQFEPGTPALYLNHRPLAGEVIPLPEEEERHVRALRLRPGDPLLLLDGQGGRTRAVVEGIDRKNVLVRAGATVLDEAEGRTYIALGLGILSDRSRFEWIVEKGVELGAREIIPLVTGHSEGRFNAGRAERIAVAALKQSQRAFLPEIPSPLSFDTMLARAGEFDRLIVCHESAPLADSLVRALDASRGARRIALLVGPEGGFTGGEIDAARDRGAMIVSLGDARLRAETAALVALALASSLSGEGSDRSEY